ncbi:tetratricopeptide repeat protein [Fibrella sp. WM1]|uniref:tetratricopeptide repeat protein n=1 Tax=Fibrella musci TaxID=3242485 RepID=UPI0035229C44
MIEFLTVASFVGYIIYLKYYADQRSEAEKQAEQLHNGILLYQTDQLAASLVYFNQALIDHPKFGVAYLYRARIYRALGDTEAALNDLAKAKSFDDTIAELHLDTGQIHYEQGNYQTAFQDFDKAIFHGNTAEAYHWRGLTRQKIGQPAEANQDMARAEAALAAARDVLGLPNPKSQLFLDRSLLKHAVLTALNAALLLFIIKQTPVVHWPYLVATASGAAIGFAEPRKGWVLALLQAFLLGVGYYVVIGPSPSSVDLEIELFSLYGAIGLTFAGSLLGSILKRAQA